MKLTVHQKSVLVLLAKRHAADGISGADLSRDLGHVRYWASDKLKALEAKGLAEVTDVCATTGSYLYSATDSGIDAASGENGRGQYPK